MAYYDDVNTDYCPNCNVRVDGIGAQGYITNDQRCSSCGVALKKVSINVASFNEAPYSIACFIKDVVTARGAHVLS